MKKARIKAFSKIMAFVMIFTMTMAMSPVMVGAASRLTSAKDILSTTKASGTGAATKGYTQSTQSVTDDFVFVEEINDVIAMATSSTATSTTQVSASLITNGGLVSGAHYTGDQVATAIAKALAAVDGDADDAYTVTYSETDDKFSIRADGGNTLNPAINWLDAASTAEATLGYTANDVYLRDAVAASDTAVAFNVIEGTNDAFFISVDQETAVPVTVAAGVYRADAATSLIAAMDTAIEAVTTHDVTVSYSGDKFRITSDETGAASTIVVTEGATDFLRTIRMNGDVPVDGSKTGLVVSADHTISFTASATTTAGDTIVITFPANFGLTGIDYEDVDLSVAGSDVALAGNASDATWGAVVSGQALTLTSGTGVINNGQEVIVKIGRNAAGGTEQISNPTTAGLYQITIEQKSSTDAIEQDANIAVYIVADDSVVIRATVDPILSFAIQGGNVLDFGTLEPNAYHKLGGARSAYGSVTLTGVTIDADRDTQTVTVRDKVYELSDDGVASGNNALVMIVNNENNYLSTAQVTANLYRAINNNDGALVRANVNASSTTIVNVMAIESGIVGNAYTLATTVTGASFSGADFTDGVVGYNNKATSVAYATGSDVENSQTGTNLVVSTNSANGYAITIQNTDTTAEADGLTNGTTDINAWTTGTYGYGILASAQSARYGDGTAGIIADAFEGDGAGDLPEAMNTTAIPLASFNGTAANDNIAIEYNVRIDASQPAGAYTDTVTYIATAQY